MKGSLLHIGGAGGAVQVAVKPPRFRSVGRGETIDPNSREGGGGGGGR